MRLLPDGGAGIVGQFQQNMQCGGNLVWHQAKVSQIPGSGPAQSCIPFSKIRCRTTA